MAHMEDIEDARSVADDFSLASHILPFGKYYGGSLFSLLSGSARGLGARVIRELGADRDRAFDGSHFGKPSALMRMCEAFAETYLRPASHPRFCREIQPGSK